MEKEFRKYILDKVDGVLEEIGGFSVSKKLRVGATRPGSRVWASLVSRELCLYVVVEFYQNSDFSNLGIGWSRNAGGDIDFAVSEERSRKIIRNSHQGVEGIVKSEDAYIFRDSFGAQCSYFDSIDELMPIERARVVYADPGVLRAALQSVGYEGENWEECKTIRYWGIAKCFITEPIAQDDCEYATGLVWREMVDFLLQDCLPFLNRVATEC